MDRTDLFLSLYRECEDLIIARFPASLDDTSPMAWIGSEVRDTLFRKSVRAIREVRNLLTHNSLFRNEGIVSPGEQLISFLEELKDRLSRSARAEDIMIPISKVVKCVPQSSVLDAIDSMLESGHGMIPVLDNGCVVKLFSRQDALVHLRSGSTSETFENMEKETDEALFIKRKAGESEMAGKLREAPVLLVTENGKKTEKVIGILTSSELLKIVSALNS